MSDLTGRDIELKGCYARIAELEESFDLYYDAIQRGTKLWQKETGLHEVLPDTAELVAWLLDLVHRAETHSTASREMRHETVHDSQ